MTATTKPSVERAVRAMADLPEGALGQMVRALADDGQNYGCNIYYHPNARPSARTIEMDGPAAVEWFAAFRAAKALYRASTGKRWRY